jgi:uncharacterized protein involved in exopolysaccharide biosynthesis
MHPKYRATAMIELNEDKSSGSDMLSSLAALEGGGSDDLKIRVETEIAVIKDDTIALAVMSKMGMLRLENPDRFSKAPGPVVTPEALPAKRREALIGNFEGHLKVKEVESSRLIAITYTSREDCEPGSYRIQIVSPQFQLQYVKGCIAVAFRPVRRSFQPSYQVSAGSSGV